MKTTYLLCTVTEVHPEVIKHLHTSENVKKHPIASLEKLLQRTKKKKYFFTKLHKKFKGIHTFGKFKLFHIV